MIRKKKTVDLRDVKTGKVTTESYDKLVLSPGAASVHPPLPGIDLPGIFHVRTVPDARTIREWIEKGTDVSRRDVQLLRHPDGQAGDAARWSSAAGSSASRRRRTWSMPGLNVTLIQKPDHVLPRWIRRSPASSRAT